MEPHLSSSNVTVEYFDPHDVYKLLAPGLIPRLPLRNLHWQSHAGPLRSIDTLHVQLVAAGSGPDTLSHGLSPSPAPLRSASSSRGGARGDDGFQTQAVGGHGTPDASASDPHLDGSAARGRRHQIPGLRPTPYLKVLLVRCDSSEAYKSKTRSEIREWIKKNAPPSSRKTSTQENHDAYEWLIAHVVLPNTAAATQPRTTQRSSDSVAPDKPSGPSAIWRGGQSSTLMEKMRSDFNGSGKSAADRVAQVRIGINDVPYDMLPRVVPAVPTGYVETVQDVQAAWEDLIAKIKDLILASFDSRVTQYEEDIKEKDAQRALPGWNFCTFFILKEGLARGFESVGLVEDALVGYDQLSVGLDAVIREQAVSRSPESHGGALLGHTAELARKAEAAAASIAVRVRSTDEETVDLQPAVPGNPADDGDGDDITISSTRKPYRELILANNVSLFDFRCYIFSRQISLLLRLANAWSSREELLAKLREQQESITPGVAPGAVPKRQADDPENLQMLAEVCRRTLQFIPAISQVMRSDVIAFLAGWGGSPPSPGALSPTHRLSGVIDNLVASFAFSVSQQILAQTSTKALPIPPTSLVTNGGDEPKASIPEPKTMMHPARTASLRVQSSSPQLPQLPPSVPGPFPGPARRASFPDVDTTAKTQFAKTGLEELAAQRAELYLLSRNILEEAGKKRGWGDGWQDAPVVGGDEVLGMEEISLDDDGHGHGHGERPRPTPEDRYAPSSFGIDAKLLATALDDRDDFYKLYEILTDKALRHYSVANHAYSVQACMTDLGVLKFHVREYASAASYFYRATPFFGESGWGTLELSMLIMYGRCLKELGRGDEYVKVVGKILARAALAQRERLAARSAFAAGGPPLLKDAPVLRGFLGDLLDASKGFPNALQTPLADFFTDVNVDGAPEYGDRRDCLSVTVRLYSLLTEDLAIDSAVLQMTCTDGGPSKELRLETAGGCVIGPGRNRLRLSSNVISPGRYRVERLDLVAGKLQMRYDADAQPPAEDVFVSDEVRVFQRTGGLDVKLNAGRHIRLGTNKPLDLELSTGWNDVSSCEIRIRAATGGLRLLTMDAKFVEDGFELARPAEPSLLAVGALPPQTSVTLRFPYSIEQDLAAISVRLEVTYTVGDATYVCAKVASAPVSLALRVNVQDVFKHAVLLSRFNIMTANASPLRLFRSELTECELFRPEFGIHPADVVTVFPREPACLLYRVRRKPGARIVPEKQLLMSTMYLRLWYSVLQTEVEELLRSEIAGALREADLGLFSGIVGDEVLAEYRARTTAVALERAGVLGELSTAFFAGADWEAKFKNLGLVPGTRDPVAERMPSFLRDWHAAHPTLPLPPPDPSSPPCSVLIPVAIPPVPVLHTADIRLDPVPPVFPATFEDGGQPVLRVDGLFPATLSLRWSRVWDVEAVAATTDAGREFGYEVTAPPDTWLIGGRKRGHFVIPARSSGGDGDEGLLSSPETEAAVPLMLIPLRDGWLPYPSVEIREIVAEGGQQQGQEQGQQGQREPCEVDFRNLGEAVRVVSDRARVTVSLDASGPGGGPLLLECEGVGGN